ncbi:MAG: fumarate hydratase [Endomicrobium sp.]|jgi:fumarate hydratase subunit alpha|nr:fumarate hydratase [Endomicrobium sp.]
MRTITADAITAAVEKLCAETNFELPHDVLKTLKKSASKEEGIAKSIMNEIIENAAIAREKKVPLCQDTGAANFFIKLGKDVQIDGGNIYDAVNKGVVAGYKNNYLRKSIVSDPLERKNTGDNTPANIYIDIVEGDNIEIDFLPKGGGSENASALKMLEPLSGWDGIKEFVLSVIKDKGKNACPPLVVGVAIGGDFASVGKLAKKALLRKIDMQNADPFYAEKECELLKEINNLGIGPMGMGGKTTALSVLIETNPTHIASLPAAVSIQCHSCRRKKTVI